MTCDEIVQESEKRGVKSITECNTETREGLYISVKALGLSPGWTYFAGIDKTNGEYIVESLGF